MVVQERDPHFQPVRHAHAIDLRQHVVWQRGRDVDPQRTVHRVPFGRVPNGQGRNLPQSLLGLPLLSHPKQRRAFPGGADLTLGHEAFDVRQ